MHKNFVLNKKLISEILYNPSQKARVCQKSILSYMFMF